MSRRRKERVRELKPRRNEFQKREGKKMNVHAKRCPYCGYEMRARGCGDAAGGLSWKCKNKKCGRTVWKHSFPAPPEPVVPTSIADKLY